jgi:hypothetical protein
LALQANEVYLPFLERRDKNMEDKMTDKLPCCGHNKIILVDISQPNKWKIECALCSAQFWQGKATGELIPATREEAQRIMEHNRPWTPAKWWYSEPLDEEINNQMVRYGGNLQANERLAGKAPEMAELLIEQVNDPYGMPLGRLERFKELLKEIGYDPDQT